MSVLYTEKHIPITRNFMVDRCGFCQSDNMKKRTCLDCGTTAPDVNPPGRRRYGTNNKKVENVSS